MSNERSVKIINTAGAMKSFKHDGVTFEHGTCELVDNSFDAGSTTIIIGFTYKDNGLTLIVQDNGIGIPELDEKGQPADNIQLVLRYGRKINHRGHPFPIGKFGFGLSQTATCLSAHHGVLQG